VCVSQIFEDHPELKPPSFQVNIRVLDIPSNQSPLEWADNQFLFLSGNLKFALGEKVFLNYEAIKSNAPDSL
jgi:hypothetical protein